MKRVCLPGFVAIALLALLPTPARADATAFWGLNTTPHDRAAQGVAIGFGLIVFGAEFEYAGAKTDTTNGSPSLTTASFNGLVMTPTSGFQLYATVGGGVFREQLLNQRETSIGTNAGGGVKIGLMGPFRLRLDYRVFKLEGSPVYPVVKRFYVGINFKF
jgi:hypothetical protein